MRNVCCLVKDAISTYSPKSIIREAVQVKFLSEQEDTQCLDIIKKRNESSHIYRQEIAESIAVVIPQYSLLMYEIANRIEKKIK